MTVDASRPTFLFTIGPPYCETFTIDTRSISKSREARHQEALKKAVDRNFNPGRAKRRTPISSRVDAKSRSNLNIDLDILMCMFEASLGLL